MAQLLTLPCGDRSALSESDKATTRLGAACKRSHTFCALISGSKVLAAFSHNATPYLSIIIPVYNRPTALECCLRSIAAQVEPPAAEIIVVDDGSDTPCTAQQPVETPFPTRVVRQGHSGIPTARNAGVRVATAPNLLFIDSDCVLDRNCLRRLEATMSRLTVDTVFQLRIEGTSSSITGLAEHCRLCSLQARKLTTDGHIRWLDTAAFAIRRTGCLPGEVFDTRASRGSDSVLLARLMQDNRLPAYVSDAYVQHCVCLSIAGYLAKALRSSVAESASRDIIQAVGTPLTSPLSARLRSIPDLFAYAPAKRTGVAVVCIVLVRYALQAAGELLSRRGSTFSRDRGRLSP
jgi:glycosyltransferase involved in cell wall biosynthesis